MDTIVSFLIDIKGGKAIRKPDNINNGFFVHLLIYLLCCPSGISLLFLETVLLIKWDTVAQIKYLF